MGRPAKAAAKRPPVAAATAAAASRGARPWWFPAISLALLIPCFWQSRIQAGDLSSHIYNAWLARLVSEGRAPGLAVVWQSTNVLFDLMLSALLPLGAGVAQRAAVSVAVLVFVWGAFAWASAVAGRLAWHVLPVIAMLAYGWVFHIGFFNFYLGLGLCFFAAAFAWKRAWIPAAVLLALAWTAHALPVLWMLALLGYAEMARRIPESRRVFLLAGAAAAILALRLILDRIWITHWFPQQVIKATGLDQVVVFDDHYGFAMAGLFALWATGVVHLLRDRGARGAALSVPVQWCVVTALGILILPGWVKMPEYRHALAYIADRMALAMGITLCVWIAAGRARAYQYYLSAAALLVFFGLLYADEAALNATEDRVNAAVAQLPPGQRVVNGFGAPSLRIEAMAHMVDRACIGRCYSYGNYEPATAQFRVRTVGVSPLVVSTYDDSYKLQTGGYVVKPRDTPLYQLVADNAGEVFVRALPAGSPITMTIWNPLAR